MARMILRHVAGLLALAAVVTPALSAGAASEHLATARQRAGAVLATVVAAVYPDQPSPSPAGAQRSSLGAVLQNYANNPGADRDRFESLVDASRRILAGGTTAKFTPAATSRWLDGTADAILADVRAAEATAGDRPPPGFKAAATELRATAQLARFHARRMIAATHFNLFKRSLRLAELVAATLTEKEAVAAWRELVATADDHPLAADWRTELKALQQNLKELEDQCCPPDEAILKETVWDPATDIGRGLP